ncbi:MAG: ABC transporter ATP-binding protein, partial [Oscillochloris sp.]|nr:ABC transporter ATP-binding protein [Oscillochloris sp.]
MAQRSEFTVPNAHVYDQRSAVRWIFAHVRRYWYFALGFYVCFIIAWSCYSGAQVLIGHAADEIMNASGPNGLLLIALTILAVLVGDGVSGLFGSLSAENVAARFEADARQELYESLLSKSKGFHDRQRAGDIMARATDDTNQLSNMIVPGATLVSETVMGIVIPLIYIAFIRLELLLVPLCFVAAYIVTAKAYVRRLNPVVHDQREQFGAMNASLEETISGIEVVKASAREGFEREKFRRNARLFRDFFVRQGYIEARYLPLLLYGFALGLSFLHAMWLYRQGVIAVGQVIAVMGLVNVLRFPTFISLFAFSLLQSGVASANRILKIVRAETDLDENSGGYSAPMRGEIVFEDVSFSYAEASEDRSQETKLPPLVLQNISFCITAGQTVAIVGQTGSGKSALTQLVNRTYEVGAGRVLIDGVDVREWSLDALRSQIGKIEQDIFLFSRNIADNIAFGSPGASRAQVIVAAQAAQAHDFISSFPDG